MRSLLAIVSMLFCVAAGVQLLGIQPAQENSIFGMIAHGLGLYCIGKGLYCAGDLWPRLANQHARAGGEPELRIWPMKAPASL